MPPPSRRAAALQESVRILAIGNPDRGDDGVGGKVLRFLEGRVPAGVELTCVTGGGVSLIAAWNGTARAYVVDAARGGEPGGTVRRFDAVAGPLPAHTSQASSHSFGLAEAIELARTLAVLPPVLIVYSVEGVSFDPGAPLTSSVAEAALHVADAILAEIAPPSAPRTRFHLTVRGVVQGVGYRPFVHRLAAKHGLGGWIRNTSEGVEIAVEGAEEDLERFRLALEVEAPPHSSVRSIARRRIPPQGTSSFLILPSDIRGPKNAVLPPDLAICPACLAEVLDPTDRRYRYPFTNCTHCGPRFSIIEALPYDRSYTTMKDFTMCAACRSEYDDPDDRRFHAQPNACPSCGPQLELLDAGGTLLGRGQVALAEAAAVVRGGGILGLKGLGGFQLVCDARSEATVLRLRKRKAREEKPFALMFETVAMVEAQCVVSEPARALLQSAEAPIVLLPRIAAHEESNAPPLSTSVLAAAVAPGNSRLGVMLPTTALHHLLLADLGFPVVATSGNLSDEPLAIDNEEALARLGSIADAFLMHNRPIARPIDDSVVQLVAGSPMVLRRARGYAPLPIASADGAGVTLGVGAQLKSTIALGMGEEIFLGQHIGDLASALACDAFERSAAGLPALYGVTPAVVACDPHPDYASTRYARRRVQGAGRARAIEVQHHHAHIVSCMAEHSLEGVVLGVSWDGTGWGPDDTVWGGEFLVATRAEFRRAGHLRAFPLAGGDICAREPRRAALGLLVACFGAGVTRRRDIPTLDAFTQAELDILVPLHLRGGRASGVVSTSSVGRLFDAAASIVGLRQRSSYEGQAAMELEFAAGESGRGAPESDIVYPLPLVRSAGGPFQLDWRPLVGALLEDFACGVARRTIASRFHETLASAIVAGAMEAGQDRVVLSGGCFQNAQLLSRTLHRLRAAGFTPYRHCLVPPNDGGIALGQVVSAMARDQGRQTPHA